MWSIIKLAIDEYKQTGIAPMLLFEPVVLATLAFYLYESIMDIKDIKGINNKQNYIIAEELENKKTRKTKFNNIIEI